MACLALTRWAQGQLIYYELPREAQDWRRLRHAARRGSAEAQHVLAGASAAGRGLACDRTRARYWYRRAATCGLPEAMYSLGMMCLIGEGGGRDGREARYWLTACARRGEAAWPHAGFAADVLASIHAGNPEPELADQAARAYWEGVAERLNGMGDADSDRLK